MPAVAVFAHQGGWDEILFVLAPLLLFAWLLRLARRRVDRLEEQEPPPGDGDDDTPGEP